MLVFETYLAEAFPCYPFGYTNKATSLVTHREAQWICIRPWNDKMQAFVGECEECDVESQYC